jgi:hypothetical protein
MLARRLTTILPEMSLAEALKITRLLRVTGLTGDVSLVHYWSTIGSYAWMSGPTDPALTPRRDGARQAGCDCV